MSTKRYILSGDDGRPVREGSLARAGFLNVAAVFELPDTAPPVSDEQLTALAKAFDPYHVIVLDGVVLAGFSFPRGEPFFRLPSVEAVCFVAQYDDYAEGAQRYFNGDWARCHNPPCRGRLCGLPEIDDGKCADCDQPLEETLR